jgi:hypothetical protein
MDRVSQIDIRLAQIEDEKHATQNEGIILILSQERLALTNERISLTSPTAPGNYFKSFEFIELFPSHFSYLYFILLLMNFI